MVRTLFFTLIIVAASDALAQDSLFYTNGMVIVGHVEEIGIEMVRYRTASLENSVIVVAEKRHLRKVKLVDGQEFVFTEHNANEMPPPKLMARDQCFSIDFLAPAMNHITAGYERSLRERTSLVVRIGYIGLVDKGNYSTITPRPRNKGALAKVGMKLIWAPPRKQTTAPRDHHPLAGWYISPEMLFSGWEQDEGLLRNPVPERSTYLNAAMNVIVGRQSTFGNCFTFDLYCGLGYGLQWRNGRLTADGMASRYKEQYAFTHVFSGYHSPLTFSAGLAFGFLF